MSVARKVGQQMASPSSAAPARRFIPGAGAAGYLLKDMLPTEVVDAVRALHRGQRVIPPAVAGRLAEYTPRIERFPPP